jgi:hypothetical protein
VTAHECDEPTIVSDYTPHALAIHILYNNCAVTTVTLIEIYETPIKTYNLMSYWTPS